MSLSFVGVRPGLLDGRAQVEFSLGVDMFVGPVAEAHGVLFGAGEAGARQPGFRRCWPASLVHQRDIQLFAFGQGLEVVGEIEQGIERDDALRLQDALDLLRRFLARVAVGRFARGG